MRGVEEHRAAVLRFHLPGDRARDDVARGELAVGWASNAKRRPFSSIRVAPSPRTASETRNDSPMPSRGVSLPSSTVGWNWKNSRSVTSAPARSAAAMPSPVATGGLVVCAYSSPAPPVASTTASASTRSRRPAMCGVASPAATSPTSSSTPRDAPAVEHQVDQEGVLDHADVARAQPRDECLLDRGAGRIAARSGGCADRSAPPRDP